MSIFSCWWWWLLLGGLLGWLASWWLSRGAIGRLGNSWHGRYTENDSRHLATLRTKDTETGKLRAEFDEWKKRPAPEPQVRVVEKIVEKPVDRVIEKIVEKPVDRVVEKLVDNPDHLRRVGLLEAEVALIAGLRSQIHSLQSAPPKIVEKIVDRPVDRIIEKIVDRPVDRVIEKIVDRPVERIVEKIVERPVDRIVEKIVEKPVEKIVYQQVDNPKHLIRVRELESQVGLIAGLRTQLHTLQSAPPKVVEKVVEKIVDRPVDRIVEKIIDRPVDRIVEKVVDNPEHLRRVRELETQVALIGGLRSQIQTLQSTPPKVVEKIVDRPVDRIVERIVDRPVDRIVEKLVPDTSGVEERDRQLRALQQRYDDLGRADRDRMALLVARDDEIRLLKLRTAQVDRVAAKAVGFTVRGMDDLEIVEGIGPKIAGLLNDAGVYYFYELAGMTPAQIQAILDKAGPNYQLAKPDTWPEQSAMAAANRWTELRRLQDDLIAGNRK